MGLEWELSCMEVLFLIRGREHPASRYRVLQYLEPLAEGGVQAEVRDFPRSRAEWKALRPILGRRPVLFVQKKRLGPLRLWGLRRRGVRVLYDFDDAVMFQSSRHEAPESFSRSLRFRWMARGSHGVVAGSGYLARLAREHNPRVWVVPTSIDVRKYPPRNGRGEGPVTLGWIGGKKSLIFLEALKPVFRRIASEFPGTRLKIVCNDFFECPPMEVVKKAWSEAEEGDDVRSFDIGLAPLPDDPWSRGKCATKLLQCMAAAVPCVASPVGSHEEIVTNGEHGLFARTQDEWVEAIARLIRDRALAERIGAAGRKRVEEAYSLSANAPRLLGILREVASP